MPKHSYFDLPLNKGHIDGPDDLEIPLGGFVDTRGFEFRRGHPHTEYGRQLKSGTDQIVSGERVRYILNWTRIDGTQRNYAVCGGRLLEETSGENYTFTTLRNTIVVSSDTADLTNGTDIAVSGVRLQETVVAGTDGDYFYFTSEGITNAIRISACSGTTMTLASSYGNPQSGPYTLWRKITGTDVNLVAAGNRLWVFDGKRRPHWYGRDDGKDSGTDIYREAGLPKPSTLPSATKSGTDDGNLTASSDYVWGVAFEDQLGNISNAILTQAITTGTDTNKCTLGSMPRGPAWVKRYRIYRCKAGYTGQLYCLVKNFPDLEVKTVGSYNSTTETTPLTLQDNQITLRTNAHINRYIKVSGASDTGFRVTANDGTSVTVSGDASAKSTGKWDLSGGFDYTQVQANGYVDLCADTDLDSNHPMPTYNDQPVTGLKYGHLFRGGGRLVAFRDGSNTDAEKTQTETWFTGRPSGAPVKTGWSSGNSGENELDYWPQNHYAGLQNSDKIMGFANRSQDLYCIKENSIWQLYQEPGSVGSWLWYPVPNSEGVGCLAPYTIIEKEGAIYFLGHDGDQVDLIRFDGRRAYGVFRQIDPELRVPRLRRILDNIVLSDARRPSAGLYQGRIYLSFPYTGATNNNRTLRFDVKNGVVDVQPWGCGVFAKPHIASGSFLFICADPGALGKVFNVLGAAQDNASNIVRTLVTGAITDGRATTKNRWIGLNLLVRCDAATDTPTLQYSTDGYEHDSGSKTWSTFGGDTFPTTAGLKKLELTTKDSPVTSSMHFRLSSTDARDYEILQATVIYDRIDQRQDIE